MNQSTTTSSADAALPSTSQNQSFREGVQWAWDSTSLKSFETCPRYYQYKHIEGWAAPEKSVHLRFGAIYATALEHFVKLTTAGMDREDAIIEVVHEALIASWDYAYSDASKIGDPAFRIPGSGAPWNTYHQSKTRSTLIRTIVWYFEHFEEDLPVIVLANGKPAVELSFRLPVDDSIVFCGHIDRLVSFADEPMVLDQKTTTATLGPYYFDQFSPDTQMSMYTFAGKVIYDMPIKGVMIDAAQIAINFSRFERSPTFRTDSQLNEWYDETMMTIERAQAAAREQYFPMRTTSCGNYGGCEFRRICSRSPEVRPQFLKGNFQRRKTWDPLESR